MAIFENFPYTNMHELNLDWILEQVKKWTEEVRQLDLKFDNLEEAFVSLKTYVKNYFDNLDIQEEIDNKLDEMLENGQLEVIIAEFLQSNSLIVFDTQAELKAGDNFVAGMTLLRLGKNSYNDKNTAIYRVRNLINTDVIDEVNIIALTNFPSLIAELITNIGEHTKRYIFIGDSFNTDDTPEGGTQIEPWSLYVAQYLGLSSDQYYTVGRSGSGFVATPTFLTLLQDIENSVTDPETITDVIVYGGANDISSNNLTFYQNIRSLADYVATQYPNAILTVGFNAWNGTLSSNEQIVTKLTYMNNAADKPNCRVIGNSVNFFHWYGGHQDDHHPNHYGSLNIAFNIANFLKGGSAVPKGISTDSVTTTNNVLNISSSQLTSITVSQQDEVINLKFNRFNPKIYCDNATITGEMIYKIGEVPISYAHYHNLYINGYGWVYNGSYHLCNIELILNNTDVSIYCEMVGSSNLETLNNVSVIQLIIPDNITLSSYQC